MARRMKSNECLKQWYAPVLKIVSAHRVVPKQRIARKPLLVWHGINSMICSSVHTRKKRMPTGRPILIYFK